MGGELRYDSKLLEFNTINKNEFVFRATTKSATALVSSHFASLTGAAVGAKYGSRIGGLAGAATGLTIGFYIENTYVRGIRFADSYFTEFANYLNKLIVNNAMQYK